jgi:putative flippase GtrA
LTVVLERFAKQMREVCFYGAASVAALAVDIGALQLLTAVFELHYLLAATISFVAGGVVLYAMSVTFVFKFRRIESRALELSVFLALGLVGLIVNSAVIYVAVVTWHVPVLAGKLVAAAFTFSTNFMLRRFVVFAPVPRPQAT